MSARELVVLGTASQVPTRHRNHNGYLLCFDGVGFLFDPGEGIQRQMTLAGVRMPQVHHVAVTHFHGDHCLGLPGVLQRASLDGVPHPLRVHFPASGRAYFDRLRTCSIHDELAAIVPCPHDGEGVIARHGALTLSTAPLDHRADAWGYRVQEDDGWRALPDRLAACGVQGPAVREVLEAGEVRVGGRRVLREEVAAPRPGQSMAFLMDTRPCDGALRLARGVDLLVCEATYLHAEVALAKEYAHMTAREVGELARAAGARRLVLTHFSQRYADTRPFVAEAGHPDCVAAEDLLRVPLPPRSP